MVITRVRPLSVAKISGVVYGAIGVVIGIVFALIGLLGAAAAMQQEGHGAAFGALFGVAGIVVFPILYGGLGFVMTFILAAVFNVAASLVGGLEVTVDHTT